mmetsp:Transcript_110952/g.310363  ORF Transcript_110952/g.310363 Transcript_110952/m.310363 type:complete len:209 (-) Transcript_110952:834-1460(-)
MVAERTSSSEAPRRGGSPASKPRATELPIHFCGTGHCRHATARPARRRTISWCDSSATSTRVRRSPTSSSGRAVLSESWWVSMKCMSISAPDMRCSMTRQAFFTTLRSPVTPRSSIGSMDSRQGGRPSKPSRRKPSQLELVTLSTMLPRSAAMRDLPCQPACAVFWPILMSSIRSFLNPQRRFFITSRSLGFCLFSGGASSSAVRMPR